MRSGPRPRVLRLGLLGLLVGSLMLIVFVGCGGATAPPCPTSAGAQSCAYSLHGRSPVAARPALRSPVSFLTEPRRGKPLAVALGYFSGRRSRLGLSKADLAGYRISSSYA